MKFKCTEYKNSEPYEWQKYTKNPFNRYFINHMVLTSVKNDTLLKKEFADTSALTELGDLIKEAIGANSVIETLRIVYENVL